MISAYEKIINRMRMAGLGIKKHTLDNEALDAFKQHIRQQQIQFELVPPGNHRRNQAERAIQTFKEHFISILAGVHDKFPLSLWCHLLKPTELTLNLLRQSKVAPKNIRICTHPRPPRLHEKAICPPRMRNRSTHQTGRPPDLGHKIRCRVQPRHINATPPLFWRVHHKDQSNKD